MKALGVVVLLVGLTGALGACSGSDGQATDPTPPGVTITDTTPSSDPTTDTTPDGGSGASTDLAGTDVCDLVRQGIDAFNVGDLDGTIAKFEDAVPLAEDLADAKPSDGTRTLLDAVRYYAGIPAKDYVTESQTSPDFERFKQFTLSECAYGGPPVEATDPAIPA